MWKTGRLATGFRETDCQAAPSWDSWRIMAWARSRNSRAEVLKSLVAGSRTVRYRSGRRNFRMLFDSMITLFAGSIFVRKAGTASARRPCSVRTHRARFAPATRNLDVSDSAERSRSSEIAQEWSAVAQSHGSPFAEQTPWPYCVILTAVHSNSVSAEIRPATTLVLPTLRECPPMTMIAMYEPDLRLPTSDVGTCWVARSG